MTILLLVLSIIIPCFLGLSVLFLLLSQNELKTKLELFSISYFIGLGLTTFILFFLQLAYVQNILVWFFVVLFLFTVFSVIMKRNHWKDFFKREAPKKIVFSELKWELLLSFLLSLQIIYVYVHTLIFPPIDWDTFANWSFSAKILYFDDVYAIAKSPVSHPDYPLLNPLAQYWTYLMIGEFNETLGKIVFPSSYLFFIIFFYSRLRSYIPTITAILASLILAITRPLTTEATIGYSDFFLMCFNSMAIIYLFEYTQTKKMGFLLLSASFLGLSLWTKQEGLVSAGIGVFILLIFYFKDNNLERFQKLKSFLAFGTIVAAIFGIFYIFVVINKLVLREGELFHGGRWTLSFFYKALLNIPNVLEFFALTFIAIDFGFIWLFFSILHIFAWRIIFSSPYIYIWLFIFLLLGVYFSVFVIGFDMISSTVVHLHRFVMHATPLALFLFVVVLFKRIGLLKDL